MSTFTPSTRFRIYGLVKAYSYRTGFSMARTWDFLYRKFEDATNHRWRQMGRWNSRSALDVICLYRRQEELLEFARKLLGAPAVQTQPEEAAQ